MTNNESGEGPDVFEVMKNKARQKGEDLKRARKGLRSKTGIVATDAQVDEALKKQGRI